MVVYKILVVYRREECSDEGGGILLGQVEQWVGIYNIMVVFSVCEYMK